ncbi:MAG: pyridoxamine 5'-phosphate oxidase [Candidatus Eisenbacteria bacterium]
MSSPHPPLDPATLGADPIAAFRRWFDEAVAAGVRMPEAMALATATPEGRPSLRWVLLKGVEPPGHFLFFTNYESRKGAEIALNREGAIAFHWEPPERQVRIEGPIVMLDDDESDAYWSTRSRDSRIAASVSQQSRPVADRAAMERAFAALDAAAPGDLPRPEHWGGYALVARAIEFWQGQPGRFHDRLRYERAHAGVPWTVERLWP